MQRGAIYPCQSEIETACGYLVVPAVMIPPVVMPKDPAFDSLPDYLIFFQEMFAFLPIFEMLSRVKNLIN